MCSDYAHILVEIPSSISVSSFVGYLKGKSKLMIFERYVNLKYKFGNTHFWYIFPTGKSSIKSKGNIMLSAKMRELKKDEEYDNMMLIKSKNR